MLKITSPPFYCAVTLMDSCVTFYFHYNFCQEHENPNAVVICKLPQCTLFGLTSSLLYNLIGQLFHFFSFSQPYYSENEKRLVIDQSIKNTHHLKMKITTSQLIS